MKTWIGLMLGIVVVASGCANHQGAIATSPPPSGFDAPKDPPINARTHFAAGQLAESQGRQQAAIQQYKQALQLQPTYADAMYRLGVVYAEVRDYQQAIDTWNSYVKVTRGSASAYSNLGFCQELAGNPTAAEAAYKKGLARDPSNEACHVNYGLMLARHNRPNEAMFQLQAVLPPAKVHYDLASVYEASGRKQEARAEYRKAIEIDPQMDDARTRLASLATEN